MESVPDTHRLSFGFASLFGFPKEMFEGPQALKARGTRLNEIEMEAEEITVCSDMTLPITRRNGARPPLKCLCLLDFLHRKRWRSREDSNFRPTV